MQKAKINIKEISRLFASSAASKFIGLAAMPVITRIYEPDEIGKFSLFSSFVAVCAVILGMKYSSAIPLPRSEKEARQLFKISLLVSTICAVLLLGVLIPINFVWGSFSLSYIMAIVLVGNILAWQESIVLHATRHRNYRIISRIQITQAVFSETCKIILSLVGVGEKGLIIGHSIGQVVSIIVPLREALRQKFHVINRKHLLRIKVILVRYGEFPKFRLPAQLILTLTIHAPIFAVGSQYSAQDVGQLGLALIAINFPYLVVGQSISRAYYGEISAAKNRDPGLVLPLTMKFASIMAAISLPIFFILKNYASSIYYQVFGGDWIEAGALVSVMSMYLIPQLISSPLLELLNIAGTQRSFFLLYVLRGVVVSSAIILMKIYSLTLLDFTKIYSTAMMLYYMVTLIFLFYTAAKYRGDSQ